MNDHVPVTHGLDPKRGQTGLYQLLRDLPRA
jgi:hypothetical protein